MLLMVLGIRNLERVPEPFGKESFRIKAEGPSAAAVAAAAAVAKGGKVRGSIELSWLFLYSCLWVSS